MFLLLAALSTTYSPTICDPVYYRMSLLKYNNTFLIHGLWIEECAQCADCGYPTSCNNNCVIDFSAMFPLWKQLQQYWYPGPNMPIQNNKLLQHEICKHGSCFNGTQYEYMNRTLWIYDEIKQRGLMNLCNYKEKACFFILDKNFQVTNNTNKCH